MKVPSGWKPIAFGSSSTLSGWTRVRRGQRGTLRIVAIDLSGLVESDLLINRAMMPHEVEAMLPVFAFFAQYGRLPTEAEVAALPEFVAALAEANRPVEGVGR